MERLTMRILYLLYSYVQIMPYNYVQLLSAANIIHIRALSTLQTRKCGVDDSESAILCIVRRSPSPHMLLTVQ